MFTSTDVFLREEDIKGIEVSGDGVPRGILLRPEKYTGPAVTIFVMGRGTPTEEIEQKVRVYDALIETLQTARTRTLQSLDRG